jgi:type IV pilus assembly protein PilY1
VGAANAGPGARQVFTLDPQRPGELLALDATVATLAKIGAALDPTGQMTEADGLDLIRWIRGQDSLDADADGDRLESRRWLLGDPLHSRPLAISYGARAGTPYSAGNPDIRIFFGSNDGIFHILRNTAATGAESGRETWAFLPPELLGMQSRLAHATVDSPAGHTYGLDGEAAALITDRDRDGNIEPDAGDAVLVFIGQRRGGRGLYAFDVTDPDSPRHLWTIDNRSAGFEQLALTFSTPRVARLDLGDAAPTPVLVFAGGYNGGWLGGARVGKDTGAGHDLIGNAVYVVDPADGRLIWRAVGPDGGAAPDPGEHLLFVANLTDSIPAPVTVIDADRNGVDDRAYVADSGGNVWRIELTEYAHRAADTTVTDSRNWYLTRLASLGGSGAADRRFFHAADVVQSRDGAGDYDGVVIVSGDRAAPRELEARNFAYLLKDRRTAGTGSSPAPAISHDALPDITESCRSAAASTCRAADLGPGWKLELQSPGEKGLSAPLVTRGRVLFTSYVPFDGESLGDGLEVVHAASPLACSAVEGIGRLYAVRLGNGAPALPAPGKIEFQDDAEAADEETDRFRYIGPGLQGDVVPHGGQVLVPGSGLGGSSLLPVPGPHWWRAYWREEEVDSL